LCRNNCLSNKPGPELDRILINDLSRRLASYLDQCALYGGGPAANRPTGLVNVPGVAQNLAIDPANLHGSFCAIEEQIENADVSMDSYGVIVSPGTRKILRTAPGFYGRINHDLGKDQGRSIEPGSYRRKSFHRMPWGFSTRRRRHHAAADCGKETLGNWRHNRLNANELYKERLYQSAR